jgi:hypothetical protein
MIALHTEHVATVELMKSNYVVAIEWNTHDILIKTRKVTFVLENMILL